MRPPLVELGWFGTKSVFLGRVQCCEPIFLCKLFIFIKNKLVKSYFMFLVSIS